MDTNGWKTPDPLPLAGWQALSAHDAARELHRRVDALPDRLRRAALAWLKPAAQLAADLEAAPKNAPLRGVPYLLKDLFDVAGLPTFAGSTFLPPIRPTPGDCTLVKLLRDRGASLAGKTHLVEFASGLTGENPHYGDCPHPRFPDRLSGGSSSGSASLVAAGVAPLSIGTDTGGSVRVPAAFCGLYGFRLTPGDALIRDAFPLAPTMDTAGWFTTNAADMLIANAALIGSSSSRREMAPSATASAAGSASGPTTAATKKPKGCYLPGRHLLASIDPEVNAACERAAAVLAPKADATTESSLLSAWNDAVDAYVTIGMSEAHRVHRDWLVPHREKYDPVIWQRFTDAGQWPPRKIAAARITLESVRANWRQFFATHDFLVLPCAPFPALTKAQATPEARRGILTLTAPASLGGLPCLTVPVPLTNGLTAGLQIIAAEPTSPVFDWVLKQGG